jgi:hypothetical protein
VGDETQHNGNCGFGPLPPQGPRPGEKAHTVLVVFVVLEVAAKHAQALEALWF